MKAMMSILVATALSVVTLSACRVPDEKNCGKGQYPVESSAGGSICINERGPIPQGYHTYPPGQTPQPGGGVG